MPSSVVVVVCHLSSCIVVGYLVVKVAAVSNPIKSPSLVLLAVVVEAAAKVVVTYN